ncbi:MULTISPECIES: HepT-like ribonuclease domain-containing protein [Parabacteroides]|uniref:HepT-like ribonuclease domain-containing protein n=1 Tax=Parabacteroides leei TaxID=2939491 RepID=UPI00189B27D2|nr:HepT-like ribonuclease domain-containing protein [Parabacteroides goldsteinii]
MESQLKEEVINRLEQIVESIDVLLERNKEITSVEDYLSTPWGMTLLDANLMRIQFIGETASAIDKKTDKLLLVNYPEIPWKQIFGMRNYISHQYADIDPDMVLVVVRKHLKPLKVTVQQIIQNLE